jgi:hypothetical protein
MKRILFLIIILFPSLVLAYGTKPLSSVTVSGTVTATIDSTKERKLVSVDVIPDPDSTKTRKVVSIDNTVTATGWADQEPVYRDSLSSGTVAATDTVEIYMGTGTWFLHVKGFYRASWNMTASTDSVKFEYRFVHGTYALTRWLPMYADTNRTDGAAVSYAVTTSLTNDWASGTPYWALLYDPSSTNPMGCIPKQGDEIEFRIINLSSTAFTATWFTVWQEN